MNGLESPQSSHRFALYVPSLEEIKRSQGMADQTFMHRLRTVLRLGKGDQCILFDTKSHALVIIREISAKSVHFEFLSIELNNPLFPEIHWLLPLFKREAFEEALYSLAEMGATTIQPIFTTKAQRSWGAKKDYERADAIMRSAAEQSKHYLVPTLLPVCELKEWTMPHNAQAVFFDGEGSSLKDVLGQLANPASLIGCVGPEADLTTDEKKLLKEKGFVFCALTPTVLRAKQAVALGVGLFRSYYRS